MRLKISHETVYRYGQPIRNLVQSLRLTPSVFEGQKTHEWQVDVSGGVKGPGFRDGAGDWIEGWTVRGPVDHVTVLPRAPTMRCAIWRSRSRAPTGWTWRISCRCRSATGSRSAPA